MSSKKYGETTFDSLYNIIKNMHKKELEAIAKLMARGEIEKINWEKSDPFLEQFYEFGGICYYL